MTYWCCACGAAAAPDPSMTLIDPRYAVGEHCGGCRNLTSDANRARTFAAAWEAAKVADRKRKAAAR